MPCHARYNRFSKTTEVTTYGNRCFTQRNQKEHRIGQASSKSATLTLKFRFVSFHFYYSHGSQTAGFKSCKDLKNK